MSTEEKKSTTVIDDEKGIVEFKPSFVAAVICVMSLVIGMSASIFVFKEKMHVAMMASLAVTMLVLTMEKCPWNKIEKAIIHGGQLMIPTALILYSIGALMGAWIASGTVPMIIYWGLKLISPFFLPNYSMLGLYNYFHGNRLFMVSNRYGRCCLDGRRYGVRC
jgi:Na+/H+ antiporter NhaC